jgi:hypothetical protein
LSTQSFIGVAPGSFRPAAARVRLAICVGRGERLGGDMGVVLGQNLDGVSLVRELRDAADADARPTDHRLATVVSLLAVRELRVHVEGCRFQTALGLIRKRWKPNRLLSNWALCQQ